MHDYLPSNKGNIVEYELPDDILDLLVEDEAVYHHDVRRQGDDLHLMHRNIRYYI